MDELNKYNVPNYIESNYYFFRVFSKKNGNVEFYDKKFFLNGRYRLLNRNCDLKKFENFCSKLCPIHSYVHPLVPVKNKEFSSHVLCTFHLLKANFIDIEIIFKDEFGCNPNSNDRERLEKLLNINIPVFKIEKVKEKLIQLSLFDNTNIYATR